MDSVFADLKYETTLFASKQPNNGRISDMKNIIYNKVKHYLNNEKIYLDPKLSLVRFSSIVGTNTIHENYI